MNDKVLLREDHGPVAVLTLNRPGARNSLSEELIGALTLAVKEIGGSDVLRAIVITGAGTAFSSGHDLKEQRAPQRPRPQRPSSPALAACSNMMLATCGPPKPVIAAVSGTPPPPAGWSQLRPRSGKPGGALATPGQYRPVLLTPMVALSRNVSRKTAMEMLLLGEMVSAEMQSRARSDQPRVPPDRWSTRRSRARDRLSPKR